MYASDRGGLRGRNTLPPENTAPERPTLGGFQLGKLGLSGLKLALGAGGARLGRDEAIRQGLFPRMTGGQLRGQTLRHDGQGRRLGGRAPVIPLGGLFLGRLAGRADLGGAFFRWLPVCEGAGGQLRGNRGMTARAITDRVRTLGAAVGLAGLSAHDLRHYWATRAARNGTPIDRLQDAGGWSSPAMPLRYVEAAKIANQGVLLGDVV